MKKSTPPAPRRALLRVTRTLHPLDSDQLTSATGGSMSEMSEMASARGNNNPNNQAKG